MTLCQLMKPNTCVEMGEFLGLDYDVLKSNLHVYVPGLFVLGHFTKHNNGYLKTSAFLNLESQFLEEYKKYLQDGYVKVVGEKDVPRSVFLYLRKEFLTYFSLERSLTNASLTLVSYLHENIL